MNSEKMAQSRRHFTDEFKRKAVRLAEQRGERVSQRLLRVA